MKSEDWTIWMASSRPSSVPRGPHTSHQHSFLLISLFSDISLCRALPDRKLKPQKPKKEASIKTPKHIGAPPFLRISPTVTPINCFPEKERSTQQSRRLLTNKKPDCHNCPSREEKPCDHSQTLCTVRDLRAHSHKQMPPSYLPSVPSELREPFESGDRKAVSTRGAEGHQGSKTFHTQED